MKFPGNNELTLTEDAIRELLKAHAPVIFGDESTRITKITTKSWPAGVVMTFTTDPDPDVPVAPAPALRHSLAGPADGSTPPRRPIGDDDNTPF